MAPTCNPMVGAAITLEAQPEGTTETRLANGSCRTAILNVPLTAACMMDLGGSDTTAACTCCTGGGRQVSQNDTSVHLCLRCLRRRGFLGPLELWLPTAHRPSSTLYVRVAGSWCIWTECPGTTVLRKRETKPGFKKWVRGKPISRSGPGETDTAGVQGAETCCAVPCGKKQFCLRQPEFF